MSQYNLSVASFSLFASDTVFVARQPSRTRHPLAFAFFVWTQFSLSLPFIYLSRWHTHTHGLQHRASPYLRLQRYLHKTLNLYIKRCYQIHTSLCVFWFFFSPFRFCCVDTRAGRHTSLHDTYALGLGRYTAHTSHTHIRYVVVEWERAARDHFSVNSFIYLHTQFLK